LKRDIFPFAEEFEMIDLSDCRSAKKVESPTVGAVAKMSSMKVIIARPLLGI